MRTRPAFVAAMLVAVDSYAQRGLFTSPSPQDVRFARHAYSGNVAEIRLGELASRKGTAADIKSFGKMMVEDHGKAHVELKALVTKLRIQVTDSLRPAAQQLYDRLAKLSGREFDRAYRQAMVADHQADIASYRLESKRGDNPEIRAYAARVLPKLRTHLAAIRATRF
ncbi:DUF4142 domain-containing protein [bacterium]|nr:MAG: DUF4142 domain-containing protein [bacterium]